jgi:hypothetical protein
MSAYVDVVIPVRESYILLRTYPRHGVASSEAAQSMVAYWRTIPYKLNDGVERRRKTLPAVLKGIAGRKESSYGI